MGAVKGGVAAGIRTRDTARRSPVLAISASRLVVQRIADRLAVDQDHCLLSLPGRYARMSWPYTDGARRRSVSSSASVRMGHHPARRGRSLRSIRPHGAPSSRRAPTAMSDQDVMQGARWSARIGPPSTGVVPPGASTRAAAKVTTREPMEAVAEGCRELRQRRAPA